MAKQATRGHSKKKSQPMWSAKIGGLLKKTWLLKSMILLSLIGLFVWLFESIDTADMLPIETVQFEGEFNYLSKQDLRQHALPYVRGGFFSVKLDGVRQALLQLPWVEDVSIRRQWPDALRIRVMEKQAVAFWGDDGLLSSRGKLFKPGSIDGGMNLPRLDGPSGQHVQMLQALGQMQAWLADTGLVIRHMQQDARRSWVLHMVSGIELRLGRKHRQERLHRFVDIYSQHLQKQSKKIRHIDMRYTNGFAVAWQGKGQGA